MSEDRRNSTMPRRERAVIGAVRLPSQRRWQIEESLEELAGLVEAAGGSVVERVVQERKAPSPALYFGKGKIDEIGQAAHARDANLFVSDDRLSPSQERNISEALGIKVVDRTALILDIFAQRARSSEGKLQVELAQLTYLLPRLVGQWRHLERLGGGIGTRGPGETQLESDRRVIRNRVMKISGELERVQIHRRLQRAGRRRMGAPVVALVGYTNAGKTTLLNRLAGVHLTAADRLFVTLDPASRRLRFPREREVIVTDTVGFIRDLPPDLATAFRATLEELQDADLLLHVVDASHPAIDEHMRAVDELLGELQVADRPTLLAFNKMDRVEGDLGARHGGVPISATTGSGIEELLKAIDGALPATVAVTLRIPHADGTALALCYELGRVLARTDEPDAVRLEVELPARLRGRLAPYIVGESAASAGMLD